MPTSTNRVVPSWWRDNTIDLFDHARAICGDRRFKKFSKLRDVHAYLLTSLFPLYPITTFHVALHKPSIEGSAMSGVASMEYSYLIKLILERISWFTRNQHHLNDPGTSTCRLVFSERKELSYEDIKQYLWWLKIGAGAHNCSVDWQYIDASNVDYMPHENETPTHLADIAASACGRALERYHATPDDRFIRNLGPTIFRNWRGLAHGLKIFPYQAEELLWETDRVDFIKIIDPKRPPALSPLHESEVPQ